MPLNGFRAGGGYVGPRWKQTSSGDYTGNTKVSFGTEVPVRQIYVWGEPGGLGTGSGTTSSVQMNLWGGSTPTTKITSGYVPKGAVSNGGSIYTAAFPGTITDGIGMWWDGGNLQDYVEIYGKSLGSITSSSNDSYQWIFNVRRFDRYQGVTYMVYLNVPSGYVDGFSFEYNVFDTTNSFPVPGTWSIFYTDEAHTTGGIM
jgi:hypothetical protein